ncbi:NAD(P)H-dependent oxidoreductase subunit E [uncultured Sunxiuqinia sp.]|uniref:NADH-quinone oxidoreductase subunit NuoE family protein n=1 Tax=uncultured Sunxiuqinia sp. TaxID=1573825 RepID=UPI002AA652F4|nr:NAD(P)H-dependent oxidoreductase subunit E [uncultured Sunxiuqinia sp.]
MDPVQDLIKNLASQHGRNRTNILQGVVEQEKYLSEHSMIEIARELDMPVADVYDTATFYSFLEYQKMGTYIIRVCKTITCSMKGKNQILLTIENMLKIGVAETTSDGKFSLLKTNCLGWCHKAPAMLINKEVYTELTPDSVRDILTRYLKKQTQHYGCSDISIKKSQFHFLK